MKHTRSLGLAYALGIALILAACLVANAANGFFPTVALDEEGNPVVSWTTDEAAIGSYVSATPLDPTGLTAPSYLNYRQKAAATEPEPVTEHSVKLPNVPLGLVIHFRAVSVGATSGTLFSSNDTTLRVITDEAGAKRLGLAPVAGPMVNLVTSESVTLCWQLNLPATAMINVRDTNGVLVRRQVLTDPATSFEVVVDKLLPDKAYTYELVLTAEGFEDTLTLPSTPIRTQRNPSSDFSFVVMGDSRAQSAYPSLDNQLNSVNYAVLGQLIRMAKADGAELALFTGDLVSGGEKPALQMDSFLKTMAPFWSSFPVYSSPGNHEHGLREEGKTWDANWRDWLVLPFNGPQVADPARDYSESTFSLDYGFCHFVAVCSDFDWAPGQIDDDQLAWLDMDLAEAAKRGQFCFVFAHQPAWGTGGHVGSSMDKYPEQRDKFWAILDKHKVKAYFAGHEHNYTRMVVDKAINPLWKNQVTQIVTGGAGAPWYPPDLTVPYAGSIRAASAEEHYVLVTLKHKRISVKVKNQFGEVLDSFDL